ncbi:MAG: RecX family transcriptional regulator [Nitrospira sp.]|nr:RecX family transcriptional regulator [Nitrospira sp.]
MSKPTKDPALQCSDPWLQISVRYLARFDRTTKQVEEFLRARGASPIQITRTVRRLATLRYLDDSAYAERWIASRLSRGPFGTVRLRVELLRRGLPEAVIDAALRRALGEVDQDALARRAVGLKQRRGSRLSRQQMLRLLRQRGFEEDVISRIMGEWPGTERGDDEQQR